MVRYATLFALFLAACGSSSSSDGVVPIEGGPGDDGSVPESGIPDAPVDAGHDAAPDAVVDAGPPFCASLSPAPKFCDDFDDLKPDAHWDAVIMQAGVNVLGVDTAQFASGPASLLASTTARAKGESSFASVRKTVTGTPTRATLAFSARPRSDSWTQGAYSIADLDVTLDHVFTLYLRDDDAVQKASLKEISGSTITYHPLSKVPPANVWTRITLDVDVANGKLSLLYGAERILDAITITTDAAMQDPTIRIGAPYVFGPSDAFDVNVDDVVLDF